MRYMGFNDDPSAHVAQGAYCQSVGATAGRMMCWWSEPTNSPAQDQAILAMCDHGVKKPILHLSTTSKMSPTEYGYKIAQAAARWPGATIEAVNEPNYPGFGGFTPTEAAAVNDAAALAAPGRVLGSAVAPYPPDKVDAPDGYFAYQDKMYGAMKNRDKLLGISVHFYPPWYDPTWQLNRAITRTAKWGLPIWVTEWNLRGDIYNGSSPDRPPQGPTAAKLVALMDADPRVKAAIWHRLEPAGNSTIRESERSGQIWASQNALLTTALKGAFAVAKATP